jgi:peptide/nickel transport system permease protein
MGKYILRRLGLGVLSAVGVSIMIFTLLRVVPGDPALMILMSRSSADASAIPEDDLNRLRKELGTDQPLPVQYFEWMRQVVTGDLGYSLFTRTPVATELVQRIPFTLQLAVLSILFSTILGTFLGTIAAVKQNTIWDYIARLIGIGGITTPVFWSATLMILFLVMVFNWIPPLRFTYIWSEPITAISQLVWPTLALGYYLTGITSRMTRAQVLEILRQDYVRTAQSKGLRQTVVLSRHVLRNAVLPLVTIVGLQFEGLLSGSVLVEQIFHIPGLGSALVQGVTQRDYPVVQALVLLFGIIIVLINLVVDILYSVVDPRIRYS